MVALIERLAALLGELAHEARFARDGGGLGERLQRHADLRARLFTAPIMPPATAARGESRR